MRRVMLFLVFAMSAGGAAGEDLLEQADRLLFQGKYAEGLALLEPEAGCLEPGRFCYEVLRRLSRFQLYATAELENAGRKDRLERYQKGMDYATRAMALKATAEARMCYAANLGRYGEALGFPGALGLVDDMKRELLQVIDADPDCAEAWHALAEMYSRLPGRPFGFGDKNHAISLSRRSVAGMWQGERRVLYLITLAQMLYDRNWQAAGRQRQFPLMEQQFGRQRSRVEKALYFEGVFFEQTAASLPFYTGIDLQSLDDREEARLIIRWLLIPRNRASFQGYQNTVEIKTAAGLQRAWE